jgi:hypothetical protein
VAQQQARTAPVATESVVTRWLTSTTPVTLGLGPAPNGPRTIAVAHGRHVVLDAFRRCPCEADCWVASVRAVGPGRRVARHPRMLVELRRHTPHQLELTVRPAEQTVSRWSTRRRERYFDQAHRLADLLARDDGDDPRT